MDENSVLVLISAKCADQPSYSNYTSNTRDRDQALNSISFLYHDYLFEDLWMSTKPFLWNYILVTIPNSSFWASFKYYILLLLCRLVGHHHHPSRHHGQTAAEGEEREEYDRDGELSVRDVRGGQHGSDGLQRLLPATTTGQGGRGKMKLCLNERF